MSASHAADGQWLLIDADDTLWENQAYFEFALQGFFDCVTRLGHQPERARDLLREDERRRIPIEGYGSRRFARSLHAVIEQLTGAPAEADIARTLRELGESIYDQPVIPWPGVVDALRTLKRRHRLHLVTKGDHEEQAQKIERSGLGRWFDGIHILADKTPETFERVLRDLAQPWVPTGAERRSIWMIGNSPRSDIKPAQAIGLRTVFIPHHTLWEHEFEVLDDAPSLTLRRFRELVQHF